MFQLQDISIARKLRLIIMIASSVALLLVSAGFVTYELVTYRQDMIHDLSTVAEMIGNESTAALSLDDSQRGEEILAALTAKKHIMAAALYKDGDLFAQYPTNHMNPLLLPAHPGRLGVRFGKSDLVLFHEIRLKGELVGKLYLNSDLVEINDRLKRYGLIILLFMLTSAAVTYWLSSILQRIVSEPISHLAETMSTVSERKNYSVRADKHGKDELGQLIDGFNGMLEQIQVRDVELQQSHDALENRVQQRTQALRAEIAERERAEVQLQQQFSRISLLNQITQAVSERQDTDSIFHVVLRQLQDHLNLDWGSVALFDSSADTLNLTALRVKNSLLVAKLDLPEGAVLKFADLGIDLCKQGQTVYASDTLKQLTSLTERLAGAGLRSFVAVPLMVENKLFGVMFAARLQPEGFTSGDCEFLRMLCEQVALAAHEASLHNQLAKAYFELRQSQQTVMQQERLKALGQMASGIAHDVNNALSPVVGFAELMIRNEPALSAAGKRHLNHIRTAGEDVAHIVARLREFYRSRDQQEALQELNLNKLAEQVVDMTRPRWRDLTQSQGLTIQLDMDFGADVPELVGIESEMREAMTNLVLNAVDALPKGGNITIRTRVNRSNYSAAAKKSPAQVILEVSDTGIGMDEETRKRCLEPFFSTKGKRGTGLGLSMVYGVVERHEGNIEILSELGKGTTFRLTFPVRKLQVGTQVAEDNAPVKPLRILCVDDEPLLRDLMKELLESEGHSVISCDGGQSGIDAFDLAQQLGQTFDVVFTDLGMPYVDGKQVAKTIKQKSPTTPVVMLTGWGAFIKEEDTVMSQVDAILSKPPRSREIRETLRRITEKDSRTNSPAAHKAAAV